MRDFEGKVAVITGGAMGIGLAIAEKAIAAGVRGVVIGDLKEDELHHAVSQLSSRNDYVKVVGVQMDASKEEDVQRLLDETLEHFGQVHLLFNNAGVGGGGRADSILNADIKKWKWVMEVNFWGVLFGCKLFGKVMVEQAKRGISGHIVNTASMAGLVTGHPSAYFTSKHAVVALTEGLMNEFQELQIPGLNASVLCPAFVATNIFDSGRYDQSNFESKSPQLDASARAAKAKGFAKLSGCISAPEVADAVFGAIEKEELYILTHDATEAVRSRAETILAKLPAPFRPNITASRKEQKLPGPPLGPNTTASRL
jgi:NAD(P)-dependent dehydrogenase (short-subunit alcohol dehydrogenase family)